MRIRHFMGYGSINAKKIDSGIMTDDYGRKFKYLDIRVEGNHEYGLVREDAYDLYNWLVKRFDKTVLSYQDILEYRVDRDWRKDSSSEFGEVEVCDYHFILENGQLAYALHY